MRRSIILFLLFIFSGVTVLQGCAPKLVKEPVILWPDQPEEPKIAYVTSYHGKKDFETRSFLDVLFGKTILDDMSRPFGVAAHDGKIYVTLSTQAAVEVIDPRQKKVTRIGDEGPKRLMQPIGIAIASDGTIYVADPQQKNIFVFDKDGKVKRTIGKIGDFTRPTAIALNEGLKRLYVVDTKDHKIRVFSTDGKALFEFGRRGEKDAEFNFPGGILVDKRNGNVLVVDTMNFRVQTFDADGKFIKKFGEVGDAPGQFGRPKTIALDSEGHIYVVDAMFHNFKIFDQDGQVLLRIGALGSVPGAFHIPAGIYIDQNDTIYVVDQVNMRVQVFQYLSDRWKKENAAAFQKLLTESGSADQPQQKDESGKEK